jgi:GH25 family lysozyme M1 (1,4-beta-N-acetylmuramidase)
MAPITPPAPGVLGIDVSHWDDSANGPMQFGQAKAAGIQWAYSKVCEGTSNDPSFAEHRLAAAIVGIPFGGYLFVRPDVDGLLQSNHFISTMGARRSGELPPALDLEPSLDADGNDRWMALSLEDRKALVATVYGKLKSYYGCLPVRYHDRDFWINVLGDPDGYTSPEWVAAYNPHDPRQGNVMIWQYSETGQVPGVFSQADLDVCNPEFLKLVAE